MSYSATPTGNLLGTVSYSGAAQTATNVGSYAIVPSGLYSNQRGYIISYANGTLSIDPATLTITGSVAGNKVYDGTLSAVLTGGSLSGVIAGDAVTLTQAGSFLAKNVGTGIGVTASDTLGGASASNYTLTEPVGLVANITPAALTVAGQSAGNKVYDGTLSAVLTGGSLSGVIAGDAVTLTQAGSFLAKNVGTGIGVTASDTLGGASASNYTLTEPVGLVANITPAALTVAGQSAGNKVYDGTLSAVLTGGSLSGVIAGDAVTLTQAGSFLAKNVGTGIGVTASDTLGGASASNYTLTEPVGLVANITPAALTVAGQSAGNKVYDGTLSAVLTGGSLSGVIAGDAVTLTQAGSFLAKNVGTGIGVTASDTLGGASASNYTLTEPVGLVANITPAALTVAGQSAGNKVYDGTLSAVLTGGSLSGVIAGDAVTLTQAGSFLAKNVGTGIGVTASDTLGGASASNYTLTEPVGLVANITPAALTVAGQSAGNKVYDGTLSAVLTGGSLSGVIAGDAVTLTQAGSFLAKNVGTGIGVTASDTLGGASASNYTLTEPVGLVANITPAALTVAGQSAGNKVYDGTLSAVLTGGSLSGVIAGDAVTLTQAGSFLAKNVGTGIGVTASDTLGGASASNYTLTEPVGLVANITPAALTVAGQSAGNKVYDGTLSAVLTGGSLSGVIAGDAVTLTQAGSFLAKNVGTGIGVTASDTLGGASASNYTLTEPVGLVANITPAALTVAGQSAGNKVYDGTLSAVLTGGSLSGVIAGDAVTLTQAGSFLAKNVGTGIGVTASDTLGGASASNYTLTEPVGLVANITPAALTVAGQSAGNKVYDGTLSAVLTGGSLSGVIAGDAVTLTQAGSFLAKNVGTGIGVTASDTLGGASASNYTLTEPVGLVANITPAALTVAGQSAGNKVYDGTLSAVLTGGSLSGVIAGDAVTLTQAGSFLAKNVGTGIGVTASDTLGGASASNYTLTEPVGLVANITPAALTVAGQSAGNKVYDGTLSAVLTGGSLSGVIAGDAVTLTQAGSFLAKNVGTGIGVTASDTLGGASASNYTLTEPVGLVANITPAALTVAGQSAGNKVYDGTLSAVLTGGSLSGVIAGDAVTLTQAGSFLAKNVGTGIGVTASDTLGGASASNYTLTEPVGLVANITPAALTVAGQSAGNKVYDGTLSAVLTGGSLSGVIAGDAVTLTQAGSFLAKNVGTGIGVTASDTLGGASASNYTLTEPVGLVANITPAALTVAGQSAGNKVYDGTLSAVLTGGSLSGVIAGDAVTLTQAGSFLAKNVGTGIGVTASDTLGGASASNYTLTEPVGLVANITPAALTVAGQSAGNKVYDGTLSAVLTGGSLSGVIAGDAVTLTQAGSFLAKNVGTGIGVTASDTLGGASASNYTLTEPVGLVANITPAALTVAGQSAGNKVYDGTLSAVLTGGSLSGVIAGDAVTLTQAGSFALEECRHRHRRHRERYV